MIGHTVYTSSFKTGRTIGLDALTHKKTFEIKQAGYTPVVSDGKTPLPDSVMTSWSGWNLKAKH